MTEEEIDILSSCAACRDFQSPVLLCRFRGLKCLKPCFFEELKLGSLIKFVLEKFSRSQVHTERIDL